ncbi:MAG: NAD(P)-dependent oxidoreductase [Acetobacteraceae bacterium]|nr:NAD(P)-dependent oxidoreductase [Acetobacteraceae bacterium]
MHIAITGGSGRLGHYVRLALADHELRVLDHTPPTSSVPDFRHVDIRDLDGLTAALQGIEAVVHLGAIDRSVATDDALTMQVNAMGTWAVFEASRRAGVRRVVHCSSSSVTGIDASNPTMPPHYLPIDEAHEARPTDAYGLSKLCSERIAEAYARRGMEVLVLRPCFVAFPDLVDFMAGRPGPAGREEPMPFLRAYVGPEDCAHGFALAIAVDYTGYGTFFLAADDAFSDQPTVTRLEDFYGAYIPVRDTTFYEAHPCASPVSNAQARVRLGWVPTTRWTGGGLVGA